MVQTVAAWFNGGGPFMWAILGVLALAVAVVIERLIFYYIVCRKRGTKLVAEAARHLNADAHDKALEAVSGSAPVNALLRTGLERFKEGAVLSEIQEAVEEAAIQEIPRLPERLNY
ncbi:MAG: hypothetical protein JXA71_12805, partial [Chitinispirillaceae bacterium]|nr:hypothetical protein [Chitinispirillaceae bacterium]